MAPTELQNGKILLAGMSLLGRMQDRRPPGHPHLLVASSFELALLHDVELTVPLSLAASRSLLVLIDFSMAVGAPSNIPDVSSWAVRVPRNVRLPPTQPTPLLSALISLSDKRCVS